MNTRYLKSYAIASAAVAMFVGCQSLPSVGPDYATPELKGMKYTLPDAGYATTNLNANFEYEVAKSNDDCRVRITDDILGQWWKRFNDPVLEELVASAVTNNRSYLMAVKRLEAKNFELLGSYAAFLPKFSLGGGWGRYHYNENASSSGVHNHYQAQQAALDGNWEIDIFGGSRRNTEAALALAEAAGWTVADAWVSLTTQIGENYINLRTTQERLAVARTNLALQSETYEILKSRLESGIGDELAVNQCAYVVEQTRAAIPTILAQEETLMNAIEILAGTVPGELHGKLKSAEIKRDWLLAPQKVDEIPLDLLRGRPDVKAAERALAAQTAYIGIAKAQWFPKLFVSGQVGLKSSGSVRLFEKDSFFATLGPAVSWPIFQGGAIYANVKATEAKMDEAALGYQLAVESAYGEIRNAYSAYSQEYHRYQALTSAVKAATDAVAISQDLYRNGLKDFNNVLDAQRSRLQLEEAHVISRGQITLKLIQLYRSLGGGLAANE